MIRRSLFMALALLALASNASAQVATQVEGKGRIPLATAAKQPALGTAGTPSAEVLSVQGVASGTAQPVSAASLPLPSGAATAAKQPALGTAGTASADVITVQGIASGTAQPASQSGTWTVQPGNTANTTAWKVDGSAVRQPTSPIPSQTGVAAGAGAVDALTQRTTLGSDDPAVTSLGNIQTNTAAPLDANGNSKVVIYKPDDTSVDWGAPGTNTTTAASVTASSASCLTADVDVQEIVVHALDANTQPVDIRLGTTAATAANATDRLFPSDRASYHWSGAVTCISVSGTQAVTFSALK